MKYQWCRIRGHRIVKHKTEDAPWHWCGCLDCGVQWTYYGAIGSCWSRPLDEDTEIVAKVRAAVVGNQPKEDPRRHGDSGKPTWANERICLCGATYRVLPPGPSLADHIAQSAGVVGNQP